MALKLYLVPVVRTIGPVLHRVPKYFWHAPSGYVGLVALQTAKQAAQDTKILEDYFLVAADLDIAQEEALTAQSDVLGVPELDNTVPNIAVRDVVRAFLEVAGIPGQWVVVGMSYRVVLRVLIGMWEFRNRMLHVMGVHLFIAGLDLDRTVSEINANVRDDLAAVAASLGLDYSAVTGTTTIRQLLYGAGQQFASTVIKLGPILI